MICSYNLYHSFNNNFIEQLFWVFSTDDEIV